MTRISAAFATLLFATVAAAATATIERNARIANGATAGGVVSAVDGNLIRVANGTITIDATGAKIVSDRGGDATLDAIRPGAIVFATLSSADVEANAPLRASTISLIHIADATLFGPVQRVDASASTLTLLGRTIHVTGETSFGGIRKDRDGARPGLQDILPNHIVQVSADEVNGRLVATSILLLAPAPPEVHAVRGKVKSIGTDAWVIERERGDDLTVLVDAQTKIVGSPKTGDEVELLYRVDSSNAPIAISIIKFERPNPPFIRTYRVSGRVESIAADAWVIAKPEGSERVTLKIGPNTKIEPGIAVGDAVEALAEKHDDGTSTAIVIVRRRF